MIASLLLLFVLVFIIQYPGAILQLIGFRPEGDIDEYWEDMKTTPIAVVNTSSASRIPIASALPRKMLKLSWTV